VSGLRRWKWECSEVAFQFRIPHSEFRTRYVPHSAIGLTLDLGLWTFGPLNLAPDVDSAFRTRYVPHSAFGRARALDWDALGARTIEWAIKRKLPGAWASGRHYGSVGT